MGCCSSSEKEGAKQPLLGSVEETKAQKPRSSLNERAGPEISKEEQSHEDIYVQGRIWSAEDVEEETVKSAEGKDLLQHESEYPEEDTDESFEQSSNRGKKIVRFGSQMEILQPDDSRVFIDVVQYREAELTTYNYIQVAKRIENDDEDEEEGEKEDPNLYYLEGDEDGEDSDEDDYRDCPVVRALYRFDARSDRELSIAPDDEIAVIDQHDSGWWRGLNMSSGLYGWFPSNYCKITNKIESILICPENMPGQSTEEAEDESN